VVAIRPPAATRCADQASPPELDAAVAGEASDDCADEDDCSAAGADSVDAAGAAGAACGADDACAAGADED
jgi:hypothetical protein